MLGANCESILLSAQVSQTKSFKIFIPATVVHIGTDLLYFDSNLPYTEVLLTHADALLCLQLHTVRSPYTVHASNLR